MLNETIVSNISFYWNDIFCFRLEKWDLAQRLTCLSSATETHCRNHPRHTWASHRTSWTARERHRWVSTVEETHHSTCPNSVRQNGDALGRCSPPQVPKTKNGRAWYFYGSIIIIINSLTSFWQFQGCLYQTRWTFNSTNFCDKTLLRVYANQYINSNLAR